MHQKDNTLTKEMTTVAQKTSSSSVRLCCGWEEPVLPLDPRVKQLRAAGSLHLLLLQAQKLILTSFRAAENTCSGPDRQFHFQTQLTVIFN